MKFKKGDVVVLYSTEIFHKDDGNYWGPVECKVLKTNTYWGTSSGYLLLRTVYGHEVNAHPFQCRKKRKSKK